MAKTLTGKQLSNKPGKSKQVQRDRTRKGEVSVEEINGRLRLRWRYHGQRFCYSLGMVANPASMATANRKASEIRFDMDTGQFDPVNWKAKYFPKYTPAEEPNSVEPLPPSRLEIWEKYTAFQTKHLSKNTIARDFRNIERRLMLVPDGVQDGGPVREWLLNRYATETARKTLMQLSAAYKWAVEFGHSPNNPYEGMAKALKSKGKRKGKGNGSNSPESFTKEEREEIINTFARHPKYSYYHRYVAFQFFTGCRPEETNALTWGDISSDFKHITINKAIPVDTGLLSHTKTGETRTIPCNDRTATMLRVMKAQAEDEHKSNRPLSESPIFRGPKGALINHQNFTNKVWREVVNSLVDSGKVRRYLPLYCCRHSFITCMLNSGKSIQDTAAIAGNTPEIILRFYASKSRNLEVPNDL